MYRSQFKKLDEPRVYEIQQLRSRKSKIAVFAEFLKEKFEALLWVALALIIIYVGNGKQSLVQVLQDGTLVIRPLIYVGLTSISIFFALYLYIQLWLGVVKNIPDPEIHHKWIQVVGFFSLLTTYISWTLALWPVWGWASSILLGLLTMSFVMAFHFIPTLGKQCRDNVCFHEQQQQFQHCHDTPIPAFHKD